MNCLSRSRLHTFHLRWCVLYRTCWPSPSLHAAHAKWCSKVTKGCRNTQTLILCCSGGAKCIVMRGCLSPLSSGYFPLPELMDWDVWRLPRRVARLWNSHWSLVHDFQAVSLPLRMIKYDCFPFPQISVWLKNTPGNENWQHEWWSLLSIARLQMPHSRKGLYGEHP